MDINLYSPYTEYVQSQDNISNKLSESITNTDYKAATEEELLGACKQFEAYFLEQVFKEMEKTVDCFKDEDSTSNYSNSMVDFFQDGAIQKIAETSTETQGLGLAQSLYEQMKRNYSI